MADKKTKNPPKVKKAVAGPLKGTRKKVRRGVRISEIPGEVKLERSPFKLKGRIQYLSTDIDSLINFVLENKKVKLSEAASKFGVPEKIVEDWARILEDHKMMDLHYPITGEPVLKVHEPKKSWKERKAEKEKLKELEKEKKAALKAAGKPIPDETKEKHPNEHKPGKSRFTKKRIFIMAEIIILAEVLIYIFVVNPHLRDSFLPTLNYQIANLPQNIMNLPQTLSSAVSALFGRQLLINPIYFVLGFLIIAIWIIVAIIRKRKKSSFAREWRKKHEKGQKDKKSKK